MKKAGKWLVAVLVLVSLALGFGVFFVQRWIDSERSARKDG